MSTVDRPLMEHRAPSRIATDSSSTVPTTAVTATGVSVCIAGAVCTVVVKISNPVNIYTNICKKNEENRNHYAVMTHCRVGWLAR